MSYPLISLIFTTFLNLSSGLKPINALEARKHKIRHIDDVIVKEMEERTADAVTPLRTLDIYSGAGTSFRIGSDFLKILLGM